MNAYTKPESVASGPLPDFDTLEIVADWRVDLTSRIRRAQLRQEFAYISPEEVMALSSETEEFKNVCATLKGVITR